MSLLAVFIALVLIGMTFISVVNALVFPRLRPRPGPALEPFISVLIPARNEAALIGRTVRGLLAQAYSNFELIVVDDNSDDDTAKICRAAGNGDARLKVLSGRPLPGGWLGKNWACHQLAGAARGELLVFTDADVQWAPGALGALVAEMEQEDAGLLTVWPTQQTITWGERLVVPLMGLVIVAYLPIPLTHHSPWPAFAAANGQCLAFRRRAYDLVGGHAAVKDKIVEDIVLARRIKMAGQRLRMADGAGLVNCRMYPDWPAVRAGYAKNILAGYGGRVSFLLLATVFHWLVFLAPWLWLALGWLKPDLPGWPWRPLILVGLGVGLRMLTAAVTRQRLLDALLLPVSVLLMTRIAFQAIWWRWRYGGPVWKGRVIQDHATKSPGPGSSPSSTNRI
jgi:chlorobactene glucosyltransferase